MIEKQSLASALMYKVLGKTPNWKGSGLDLVQVYRLNKLNSLNGMLKEQLQDCFHGGIILDWMIENKNHIAKRYKQSVVYH